MICKFVLIAYLIGSNNICSNLTVHLSTRYSGKVSNIVLGVVKIFDYSTTRIHFHTTTLLSLSSDSVGILPITDNTLSTELRIITFV